MYMQLLIGLVWNVWMSSKSLLATSIIFIAVCCIMDKNKKNVFHFLQQPLTDLCRCIHAQIINLLVYNYYEFDIDLKNQLFFFFYLIYFYYYL